MSRGTDPIVSLAGLRDWYRSAPGQAAASADLALASQVLPDLFGYHLLQIGLAPGAQGELSRESRISHRMVLALAGQPQVGDCRAWPTALPIKSDAVDVVVLPHVLEFSSDPQGVLREVERVLIGEGRLLIIGFNPYSLFGVWRGALAWRGCPPWSGRFLSVRRLSDWLGVLGFTVERVDRLLFRPPLARDTWFQRLAVIERLGAHFWPLLGGIYGILARKRVLIARPIRLRMPRERRRTSVEVTEPSVREPTVGSA